MTKINISPSWSKVKPKGFYVYIHRRATDGSVFYVGKGHSKRAWICHGGKNRSKWWSNIAKKNGIIVDIIKDGLTETESFRLEMLYIRRLKESGVQICNQTIGGDGASGVRQSLEVRIKRSVSNNGRRVYCSNGMMFYTAGLAQEWLKEQGYLKASSSGITACCRGRCKSYLNYAWSYNSIPDKPLRTGRDSVVYATAVPVVCSNGMSFSSLKEASTWLSVKLGKLVSTSHISSCCSGRIKRAYGYQWSYKNVSSTRGSNSE